MDSYLAIALAVLGLTAEALMSAYFFLAPHELKRRSSRGKEVFQRLYLVAQYGSTARQFLEAIIVICIVSAVILVSQSQSFIAALGFALVLAILLAIVSRLRLRSMVHLAAWLAPYLVPLLHYVDVIKARFRQVLAIIHVRSDNEPEIVTELYIREDLEHLLQLQKKALNNRIDVDELDRALNALDFSGKHIKGYMQPRKEVKFVTAKEPIGPILLSELHKTGQTTFPVRGNSRHEILGMLELRDLSGHDEGGTVADAMSKKAYFVRETEPLVQVLQAFSKTKADTFMVVNVREKIVGMISVDKVVEILLGHPVNTEFEEFDDISSVAHASTSKESGK